MIDYVMIAYNVFVFIGICWFWYINNKDKDTFKKWYLRFYYGHLAVSFLYFYGFNDDIYRVSVFLSVLNVLINLLLCVIWRNDWRRDVVDE